MSDSSVRYCKQRGELIRGVSLSRQRRHQSDDVSAPSPGFVRVASLLEARGINTAPASQESTSVGTFNPFRLLSTSSQQQQQQPPQASLLLSTFERETIRTRGRPWSSHPAKRFSEDAWYPIWHVYQRLARESTRLSAIWSSRVEVTSSPSSLPLPPLCSHGPGTPLVRC